MYLKIYFDPLLQRLFSDIWVRNLNYKYLCLKKGDAYKKENVKQNESDFKRLEGKKLSVEFNGE